MERIFQLERYETKDTAVQKNESGDFYELFCRVVCISEVYYILFYEVFGKVYDGEEGDEFKTGREESLADFEGKKRGPLKQRTLGNVVRRDE